MMHHITDCTATITGYEDDNSLKAYRQHSAFSTFLSKNIYFSQKEKHSRKLQTQPIQHRIEERSVLLAFRVNFG